jgi:hypothetical protein
LVLGFEWEDGEENVGVLVPVLVPEDDMVYLMIVLGEML